MVAHKKGEKISVVSKILAEENRERFRAAAVAVIDIIGSPGAGKTALLEATLPRLAREMAVGVIVGDISTTRDAERIAATGVPVVQITTDAFGGACHLEASTIRQALDHVSLEKLDLLFVENVGNLVCPAEFDLGQDRRAVVLSVTEGEDKPLKYPLAFREASVVVVSKIDLLPHLTYDMAALRANLKQIQPGREWCELSARTGEGMDAWLEWIRKAMTSRKKA
jgi:hydrogenase nickel incorporation protein HypB